MTYAKLQTSPYLTCHRPSDQGRVIYMTDPKAPEYPNLAGAPKDALYGISGLDRVMYWFDNTETIDLLKFCSAQPRDQLELADRFAHGTISDVLARGWLQDPSDLCREYFLRTGQIEITAHCNWSCRFCPVSTSPKAAKTMSLTIFEKIVEQLAAIKTVRFVTFHFFNEPTLDKYFKERLLILNKYKMPLALYSNFAGLTEKNARLLLDFPYLYQLVANLPSSSEERLANFTGSASSRNSIRNLRGAINLGIRPITIVVNGTPDEVRTNLPGLREEFATDDGIEVVDSRMCDRAGLVGGGYEQDVYVKGPLRGCAWPVNHAYFSVDGDMFLCCNDYHQSEKFGNICSNTLEEIMTSDRAVQARRKVFGVQDAEDNFICRNCHDQLPTYAYQEFRPIATDDITFDPKFG